MDALANIDYAKMRYAYFCGNKKIVKILSSLEEKRISLFNIIIFNVLIANEMTVSIQIPGFIQNRCREGK